MSRCHCGDAAEHEHGLPDDESAMCAMYALYTRINLESLTCLNESVDGSGKSVFKAWDERLDRSRCVESDVDEELLFNIPFCGLVKLKSIIIIGGSDGHQPTQLRLFKNREQMSFDQTKLQADQEFALLEDPTGEIQYPIRTPKFSDVHHLSVHIPSNGGADTTLVLYIGLRGEYAGARPDNKVVNAVYEARPMPDDHKTHAHEEFNHFVM